MSEPAYRDPAVTLSRIYTKTGDAGHTRLVNGRQVPKDDLKIDAYGTVDELLAFIGQARLSALELGREEEPSLLTLADSLLRVQHELFNLGSILATDPDSVGEKQPRVTRADIARLEAEIDAANDELEPLRSFVLPGGCRLNVELHQCRTICRRAERLAVGLARREAVAPEAVQYLNRLSDALFVWSRWVCHELDVEETLWDPNRAASGGGSSR